MRAAQRLLAKHGAHTEGYQLVLLRHGQSEWNASKRFSGWMDIDLTEKGRQQAKRAGKLMKLHELEFDEAHASVLKRAVRTLWTALHSCNQHWIPVKHTWRLNERHYGMLTGLSKTEAAAQLGDEMLLRYRRGYDTEPLAMTEDHPCWTGNDRRYRDLGPLLPRGESLKQCKERILPYWYESVVPSVRAGRRVLVAAHNNVIRCICKHLDDIKEENLRAFEVPTGAPLVYTLDPETLEPIGEPDSIGFRGRFLEAPEGFDDADRGAQPVNIGEVVNLAALQREAARLGLDLGGMKVLGDAEQAMRRKSTVYTAAHAERTADCASRRWARKLNENKGGHGTKGAPPTAVRAAAWAAAASAEKSTSSAGATGGARGGAVGSGASGGGGATALAGEAAAGPLLAEPLGEPLGDLGETTAGDLADLHGRRGGGSSNDAARRIRGEHLFGTSGDAFDDWLDSPSFDQRAAGGIATGSNDSDTMGF